jgi:hypothetical protein
MARRSREPRWGLYFGVVFVITAVLVVFVTHSAHGGHP